jgi:hypothetical protein
MQLIGKTNIGAVSIEHATRVLLPTGDKQCRKKQVFSACGLNSLNDEGYYLGKVLI